MPDLALRVNGLDFQGWKSARVTRGIESISGGFELGISDRWSSEKTPWPIFEGDECELVIGDLVVITGRVDKRSISYGAEEHTFSVTGRDKTAAMVDCSAVQGRDKWEFASIDLLELAKKLAKPFGIKVSIQPGLAGNATGKINAKHGNAGWAKSKVSIDPGETAFAALEKACKTAGVLPVADGKGGLLLTRSGSARAGTELVEGENILSASADYDASARFRTYVVLGAAGGWAELGGSAAVSASATDERVADPARIMVLRSDDGGLTIAKAKTRAQWEAIVRAARGQTARATVQGWTQSDGSLWPINALVRVKSPLLGIDDEMLICETVCSLDDGGAKTELSLKRPDAFLPEPIVVKGGGTGPWAELYGLNGGGKRRGLSQQELEQQQSIPPEYQTYSGVK